MPYGFIFADFYEASIRHDRSLDSPPFITVKATDVDSGDNGKVDYELQDSSDFFTVGSTDGGIRLKATPPSGRFFSLLLQSISKTSRTLPKFFSSVEYTQYSSLFSLRTLSYFTIYSSRGVIENGS